MWMSVVGEADPRGHGEALQWGTRDDMSCTIEGGDVVVPSGRSKCRVDGGYRIEKRGRQRFARGINKGGTVRRHAGGAQIHKGHPLASTYVMCR